MSLRLWRRMEGRLSRDLCRWFGRRPWPMQSDRPLISFTFDDFPKSAWIVAGEILREYNLRATYYISLGLMGGEVPAGQVFEAEDLAELVADGHELGCHTYAHCPSWETPSKIFEQEIIKNAQALKRLFPRMLFQSLSWPISCPRPQTKRLAAKYFAGCRGGGQNFNIGTMDLNYLQAFFIEQSRQNPDLIMDVIQRNSAARGWLILATHDVGQQPSRLGCTTALLRNIVQRAIDSGAEIVPVGQALHRLGVSLAPKALNSQGTTRIEPCSLES
jgi:peptidoglycan/xylan/chitin deacetylase (PgdA/CDA1 family)